MEKNIENVIPCINPDIEMVKTKDMRIICFQKTYNYRVNLNQNTYDVINLINGNRTISQITKEFNEKRNAKISEENIFELLDGTLKKSGIINMGDGYRVNRSEPSYLRLRINLISSKYSSYISRYLKYLFKEKSFWTSFIIQNIIVYSLFILYVKDMYFQLENIKLMDFAIITLLMGIALFAHEFGHISACVKFGVHPGSIGFGFYLFTPVMYADVSDIWRLPREQRIIVNMAGIFMGNFMAIIAFVLFVYTNNIIFLYVFSLQCIEGICNLNPLLKYDGYWMLSDILKLPNMSNMAYKKVKKFSFNLLKTYNAKDWYLLLYGIISPVFIMCFLTTVLILSPDSVLYFPKNFIMSLYNIIQDINSLNFLELANFSPYFLFYWLVVKFSISFLKSRHEKRCSLHGG